LEFEFGDVAEADKEKLETRRQKGEKAKLESRN